MAVNIRLLRRRIKTAKNIAQITHALEMVSASKMRRAQEKTVAGKPYAEKLRFVVQNLAGRIEEGKHPYLIAKETGTTLLLLFSPDKGLCGSLNTNLLREFLRVREQEKDLAVISVGRKLRHAIIRTEGKLVADFPFGAQVPSFDSVFPLVKLVSDGFLNNTYKKVICLYTQFLSIGLRKPTTLVLLPIQKEELQKDLAIAPYLFEPNAALLLMALMPHYLEMSIYQILLETYASEQASRMMAMHEAFENAKDVIWELSLYYNKARQERITNELLDIFGGMGEHI